MGGEEDGTSVGGVEGAIATCQSSRSDGPSHYVGREAASGLQTLLKDKMMTFGLSTWSCDETRFFLGAFLLFLSVCHAFSSSSSVSVVAV